MPDPSGLYYLKLVGRLAGQLTQNGFYFVDARAAPPADHAANCQLIILDFNEFILDKIKDFANQQWANIAVTCATMIPRHGPIAEMVYEVGGGVQPDDSLPPHDAGLLSLRTGFGGRSGFGRSFFAGVSEGDHEAGKLIPAAHARLQSIGDALIGRFGSLDETHIFHYGLYSHTLGSSPAIPPDLGIIMSYAGFRPIRQTVARHELATQRHRRLGHGA